VTNEPQRNYPANVGVRASPQPTVLGFPIALRSTARLPRHVSERSVAKSGLTGRCSGTRREVQWVSTISWAGSAELGR
jgi:hypothetical protein